MECQAGAIAVMCARLRPWQDRLGELPAALTGHRGDYQATQARLINRAVAAAERRRTEHVPTSTAVRAEAQLAVRRHFAELTHRRRTSHPLNGSTGAAPDARPRPCR
jgi:hypothetical protein